MASAGIRQIARRCLGTVEGRWKANVPDALDFAGYVRDRWLAVAVLPAASPVCLAFGVSSLLPRKYTATKPAF